jgi:hypothetical protein
MAWAVWLLAACAWADDRRTVELTRMRQVLIQAVRGNDIEVQVTADVLARKSGMIEKISFESMTIDGKRVFSEPYRNLERVEAGAIRNLRFTFTISGSPQQFVDWPNKYDRMVPAKGRVAFLFRGEKGMLSLGRGGGTEEGQHSFDETPVLVSPTPDVAGQMNQMLAVLKKPEAAKGGGMVLPNIVPLIGVFCAGIESGGGLRGARRIDLSCRHGYLTEAGEVVAPASWLDENATATSKWRVFTPDPEKKTIELSGAAGRLVLKLRELTLVQPNGAPLPRPMDVWRLEGDQPPPVSEIKIDENPVGDLAVVAYRLPEFGAQPSTGPLAVETIKVRAVRDGNTYRLAARLPAYAIGAPMVSTKGLVGLVVTDSLVATLGEVERAFVGAPAPAAPEPAKPPVPVRPAENAPEPAKAEPAKSEPGKSEPAKPQEPAKAPEPVKTTAPKPEAEPEVPRGPAPPERKLRSVRVESTPPGAEIWVNGRPQMDPQTGNPAKTNAEILLGDSDDAYEIELRLNGYQPRRTMLVVKGSDKVWRTPLVRGR